MLELSFPTSLVILLIILQGRRSWSVVWSRVLCSVDPDSSMPEGASADLGRFPWLGIVQHGFDLEGRMVFAVTTGVLVHPGYAIAAAEDISRIPLDLLVNNTKFIMYRSENAKSVLEVTDYIIHPDFIDGTTVATIALLELNALGMTGAGGAEPYAPVSPVCLPISGSGTFEDFYAVRITDVLGQVVKEITPMKYVDDRNCEEFYYLAHLTYKKMKPTHHICAVHRDPKPPCVWEAGVVLITRQSWGLWKLIGFSPRTPGCGAPARFIYVHRYLTWMDEVISRLPPEELQGRRAFFVRQTSPYKLHMYPEDVILPDEYGQCTDNYRGRLAYRDSSEILTGSDLAQGYFFLEVSQVSDFTCLKVNLKTMARTNTGIWVEHHCHRDMSGNSPLTLWDERRIECFMYFKSTAYVEFRFLYSFKADISVALYGTPEIPRFIPNPFAITETTEAWFPTQERLFRSSQYMPYDDDFWYEFYFPTRAYAAAPGAANAGAGAPRPP